MPEAVFEEVGFSRGWIKVAIDGREATFPGEFVDLDDGNGMRFAMNMQHAFWSDRDGRLSPELLEQAAAFLAGPNSIIE